MAGESPIPNERAVEVLRAGDGSHYVDHPDHSCCGIASLTYEASPTAWGGEVTCGCKAVFPVRAIRPAPIVFESVMSDDFAGPDDPTQPERRREDVC